MTARYHADGTFRMIADVEGPVHVAVPEQDATRCVLDSETSDGDF